MRRPAVLLLILSQGIVAQATATDGPVATGRTAPAEASPKKAAADSATLVFDLEFQHRLTNKTKGILEDLRIQLS